MKSNLKFTLLFLPSFSLFLVCILAQPSTQIQAVQQSPEDDDIQNLYIPNNLPPTPVFPNNIGNWSIFYTELYTSKTCIKFLGAIRLNFTLNSTTQIVDVPAHADVKGSCARAGQNLSLHWDTSVGNSNYYYDLHVSFVLNSTAGSYSIDKVSLDFESRNQDYNESTTFTNQKINLTTAFNTSYFCNKTMVTADNLTILTASLQFEAFRPTTLDPYEFEASESICGVFSSKPNSTTTTTFEPVTTSATTGEPTTTTFAPVSPSFPNNIGNWSIYSNSTSTVNTSCLLLTGAFQLRFTEKGESIKTSIDVPSYPGLVIGNCGNDNNTIFLGWVALRNQLQDLRLKSIELYVLKVVFSADEKRKSYFISDMVLGRAEWEKAADFESWNLQFANSFFTDGNQSLVTFEINKGEYFSTSLNRSYACKPNHQINGDLTVGMANVWFEAFRPSTLQPFEFDKAEDCEHSGGAARIGLIVGVVLIILVLVVVVIYIAMKKEWIPKLCFGRSDSYVPLGSD